MNSPLLSKSIGEDISSPNRVVVTPNHYAGILVGFPDLVSTWNGKKYMTLDSQQCGILTSVDSGESVHPHFEIRNPK